MISETRDQGSQTRVATAETGTQYVVDEPPRPLVSEVVEPLVDSVRSVRKAELEEEDEKVPAREPQQIFYSAGDIQRLRDQGKITREWLSKFQAKRANDPSGLTLVGIASKLGRTISREDQKILKKPELIDLILQFIKK